MNNISLELFLLTDELRARHVAVLQRYLSKEIEANAPSLTLASRTLICDAANGERKIPDYKSLKNY